jgi:hypothetical protein
MKYQFCVRFNNVDANSAASKAVLDCNRIFLAAGYRDYTLTVGDNSRKFTYYLSLFKSLARFFLSIKKGSLVGIQYPLLSVNNVFGRFIKAARKKEVRFFCIVHDLESLRTGEHPDDVAREVARLNDYDHLIVHNKRMRDWLTKAGVIRPMVILEVFDYLPTTDINSALLSNNNHVVYAGNLIKSKFVDQLGQLNNVQFNLYGPGFSKDLAVKATNVHWLGQYAPDEIPAKLSGAFGLIWDGNHINRCDELLGNYLQYNNPHKFSLYLAAGLPVIAPKTSAIGVLIKQLNLGLLIDNLYDLEDLKIDDAAYHTMRSNVYNIRKKIISGHYFAVALKEIEHRYAG